MNNTAVNYGKLVASHQVKLVYARTHTELEKAINDFLSEAIGKYEVRDVVLDFSQSGAWIAMVHYYEHVRLGSIDSVKTKNQEKQLPSGTRHIAPSENTPMSHNVKPSAPKLEVAETDRIEPIDKPTHYTINPVQDDEISVESVEEIKPEETKPVESIEPEEVEESKPIEETQPVEESKETQPVEESKETQPVEESKDDTAKAPVLKWGDLNIKK